jgi:transketolase
MDAAKKLHADGYRPRVVSMPCWELFAEQSADYRQQVLPNDVSARVAVEAGLAMGWREFTGFAGEFVGMTGFGASAPSEVLYEHFGITVEKIVEAGKRVFKS